MARLSPCIISMKIHSSIPQTHFCLAHIHWEIVEVIHLDQDDDPTSLMGKSFVPGTSRKGEITDGVHTSLSFRHMGLTYLKHYAKTNYLIH